MGDEVVVSCLKELTDSSRFIAATPGPAANSRKTAGNQQGKVFSIEKVRDELIGGDDELAEWLGRFQCLARGRSRDPVLSPRGPLLCQMECQKM